MTLYRVMAENGLFTRKWRATGCAPVAAANQTLVAWRGERIKVEDYLVPEQTDFCERLIMPAVQGLGPKRIFGKVAGEASTYMQRCMGADRMHMKGFQDETKCRQQVKNHSRQGALQDRDVKISSAYSYDASSYEIYARQ